MRILRRQLLATLWASALVVTGCVPPAEQPAATTEQQFDPEAGWVVGSDGVAVRAVWTPPGYWVTDMNASGDLLLSTVAQPGESRWLLPAVNQVARNGRSGPSLYGRKAYLPFPGQALNAQQQVLGPSQQIYRRGTVTALPDPCAPELSGGLTLDCYIRPIPSVGLADNGDVLVTFRKDYVGTNYSPWQYLLVWRAAEGQWVKLQEIFGEGNRYIPVISPGGTVASRLVQGSPPFNPVTFWVAANGALGGYDLWTACPAEFPNLDGVTPTSVNDAGEMVGTATCYDAVGTVKSVPARWPPGGAAIVLPGPGKLIDAEGNVVGTRPSDEHVVVWMKDGSVKDLSAVIMGPDPVTVKKILPGHQVFGVMRWQGLVWRY